MIPNSVDTKIRTPSSSTLTSRRHRTSHDGVYRTLTIDPPCRLKFAIVLGAAFWLLDQMLANLGGVEIEPGQIAMRGEFRRVRLVPDGPYPAIIVLGSAFPLFRQLDQGQYSNYFLMRVKI